METFLVVLIIVAPTLIDLTVQYFIHRRTVRAVRGCPKCPHIKELEEVKE